MGLFQKKPMVSTSAPGYLIAPTQTLLVIGLGNPGKEYEMTRHNVGYLVIDELAKKIEASSWVSKKVFFGQLTEARVGTKRVIICKPTTYMNDSGKSALAVRNFYKLENHQILVVYDELALPFGTLRSRFGNGDAGHNGVKSLVSHLGSGFGRLRIGISNSTLSGDNAADFVLAKFSKVEQANLALIIQEACAMASEYIYTGDLPHDTHKILS